MAEPKILTDVRNLKNNKADKSVSFEVIIPTTGWSTSKTINISNNKFLAANIYAYIVGPDNDSMDAMNDAGLTFYDITSDGIMTVECAEFPTEPITLIVTRLHITQ